MAVFYRVSGFGIWGGLNCRHRPASHGSRSQVTRSPFPCPESRSAFLPPPHPTRDPAHRTAFAGGAAGPGGRLALVAARSGQWGTGGSGRLAERGGSSTGRQQACRRRDPASCHRPASTLPTRSVRCQRSRVPVLLLRGGWRAVRSDRRTCCRPSAGKAPALATRAAGT
jgi:hypothetical protein